MEKHLTLLATLQIVYHAFGVIAAGFILFILGGAGVLSEDPEAMAILGIVGSVLSTLLLVFAAPGIIGAVGILKRQGWARILLLIVAFFGLPNFPLGTGLGVYTFWVLMQDEAIQMMR